MKSNFTRVRINAVRTVQKQKCCFSPIYVHYPSHYFGCAFSNNSQKCFYAQLFCARTYEKPIKIYEYRNACQNVNSKITKTTLS